MAKLNEGKTVTPPPKKNVSTNKITVKQQDGKPVTPPPKPSPKTNPEHKNN